MRKRFGTWWACWASLGGAAALLLLVAQFVWRGVYLWGGFYTQDDFNMLRLGADSDLTLSYLMQEYAGHVWPGNFLVAWLAARVDPSSWILTATMIALVQLACGAMMWVVLCRIATAQWVRLAVLAAYLTCPLTMWATQWWASAIGFLPLCFFMLVAVWGLLRRIQDDWRPGSVVVVVATLGGLAFQERAVLFPILLGGVAVLLAEGSLWSRIKTSLSSYRRLWIGLAVSTLLVLVVHLTIASLEVSGGGGGGSVWRLMRDFLFRNLLPGLSGGPWIKAEQVGGALVPTLAASIIGTALAVGFAVVLCVRCGRSGRLAMLLLGVYIVADMALLFAGRTQYGVDLGLVPRYAADIVPVACLTVAFAFAAWPAQHSARDRRWVIPDRVPMLRPDRTRVQATGLLGAIGLTAYVVMALVTTAVIAPMEQNQGSRAYVETLSDQIRSEPSSVIYDASVPDEVMLRWFLDSARVSTVLSVVPEDPVLDVGSESLLIPDDRGVLQPLELALVERLGPPVAYNDCGYALSPGETYDVALPAGRLRSGYVLKLSYFSAEEGIFNVSLDGETHSFAAQEGTEEAYLVVENESTRLRLGLERGATVCVTGVISGYPAQELD